MGISAPCPFGSPEDGFDPEEQFFHAEGFGDVIICSQGKSFQHILLHGFGSKENDGDLTVEDPDLRGQGKAILHRHHHIQQAEVVMELFKMPKAFSPLVTQSAS